MRVQQALEMILLKKELNEARKYQWYFLSLSGMLILTIKIMIMYG